MDFDHHNTDVDGAEKRRKALQENKECAGEETLSGMLASTSGDEADVGYPSSGSKTVASQDCLDGVPAKAASPFIQGNSHRVMIDLRGTFSS